MSFVHSAPPQIRYGPVVALRSSLRQQGTQKGRRSATTPWPPLSHVGGNGAVPARRERPLSAPPALPPHPALSAFGQLWPSPEL